MNPAATPRDPYALDRETLIVCGVVVLGAGMTILDMTVVNVAIDRLAVDFGASFTTIQWVVTAYTLALAAVIPITGWASDRFGTKRIYIAALAAFVTGSALCALAWSAESLIAFRVLQGLGGGMILPVVTTIVTKQSGPLRRGRVMGILGVPMLAAPVLGPILGGWLVDDVSWRWIFLINLPLGLLAIALAQLVLERDRPQPAHPLDWLGIALLSPGLALLIFGFAESPESGFGAPQVWLPVAVGAALIAVFARHSWRTETPLIDVKTFIHSRAGAAAVTLFLLVVGVFGVLLLMPVYFQVARGTSALESGLLLAPQGIGTMVAMPIAGWLSDRYGPERLPLCGVPMIAVGVVPFALLTPTTSFVLLSGSGVILGAGLGISFMPTITAAMNAVPEAAIARTSTAMNILDQTGASIGTAIVSVILVSAVGAELGAIPGVAGEDLGALHDLSAGQRAALAEPISAAFTSTFAWTLALVGLAAAPAWALAFGRRHRRVESRGVSGRARAAGQPARARAPRFGRRRSPR